MIWWTELKPPLIRIRKMCCWLQGEFDMNARTYDQQPALFAQMVRQFRADLADHAGQCPDFNADSVP
ncbi:hypothetical protein DY703_25725 [Salmonella enterica]|nr:hypothetical protein [Salmonella enterica]EBJ7125450.1 hypothetical protein [Salmonella enterica]EBQ9479381.1 hypothetical protein [Salmonella enterica subsp. enterica serovar Kokomlemle]EBU8701563.1 hypothetical protein [Salmonella enterica subsp. enterica serovar Kokomlemle]ECS5201006.1 hypothetical protein [Salmonella enterica subsp. enterica serovar Poano]